MNPVDLDALKESLGAAPSPESIAAWEVGIRAFLSLAAIVDRLANAVEQGVRLPPATLTDMRAQAGSMRKEMLVFARALEEVKHETGATVVGN